MPATTEIRPNVQFTAKERDFVYGVAMRYMKDEEAANDVAQDGVMGGDENEVLLVSPKGVEAWPKASKTEVARRLAARIAEDLA